MLQSIKKTANGLVALFKDGTSIRLDSITEAISGTMTGFSSGGAYSGTISRAGKQVTLSFITQATGTKSGTSAATITIPASYRPSVSTVSGIMNFSHNGNVRITSLWTLTTGGVFSIYSDLTGSTLANASGCGFNEGASVSWVMN